MKSISKGCRAVVVNSVAGNNGLVVTVLGRAPADPNYSPRQTTDWWFVDKTLKDTWGGTADYAPESMLQRIDDDDVELGRWEDLKSIWQPPKVEETA